MPSWRRGDSVRGRSPAAVATAAGTSDGLQADWWALWGPTGSLPRDGAETARGREKLSASATPLPLPQSRDAPGGRTEVPPLPAGARGVDLPPIHSKVGRPPMSRGETQRGAASEVREWPQAYAAEQKLFSGSVEAAHALYADLVLRFPQLSLCQDLGGGPAERSVRASMRCGSKSGKLLGPGANAVRSCSAALESHHHGGSSNGSSLSSLSTAVAVDSIAGLARLLHAGDPAPKLHASDDSREFFMLSLRVAVCCLVVDRILEELPRFASVLVPAHRMLLAALFVDSQEEKRLRRLSKRRQPTSPPVPQRHPECSVSTSTPVVDSRASVSSRLIGRAALSFQQSLLSHVQQYAGSMYVAMLEPYTVAPTFVFAHHQLTQRTIRVAYENRRLEVRMLRFQQILEVSARHWVGSFLRGILRSWLLLVRRRALSKTKQREKWKKWWRWERVRSAVHAWRKHATLTVHTSRIENAVRARMAQVQRSISHVTAEMELLEEDTVRLEKEVASLLEEKRQLLNTCHANESSLATTYRGVMRTDEVVSAYLRRLLICRPAPRGGTGVECLTIWASNLMRCSMQYEARRLYHRHKRRYLREERKQQRAHIRSQRQRRRERRIQYWQQHQISKDAVEDKDEEKEEESNGDVDGGRASQAPSASASIPASTPVPSLSTAARTDGSPVSPLAARAERRPGSSDEHHPHPHASSSTVSSRQSPTSSLLSSPPLAHATGVAVAPRRSPRRGAHRSHERHSDSTEDGDGDSDDDDTENWESASSEQSVTTPRSRSFRGVDILSLNLADEEFGQCSQAFAALLDSKATYIPQQSLATVHRVMHAFRDAGAPTLKEVLLVDAAELVMRHWQRRRLLRQVYRVLAATPDGNGRHAGLSGSDSTLSLPPSLSLTSGEFTLLYSENCMYGSESTALQLAEPEVRHAAMQLIADELNQSEVPLALGEAIQRLEIVAKITVPQATGATPGTGTTREVPSMVLVFSETMTSARQQLEKELATLMEQGFGASATDGDGVGDGSTELDSHGLAVPQQHSKGAGDNSSVTLYAELLAVVQNHGVDDADGQKERWVRHLLGSVLALAYERLTHTACIVNRRKLAYCHRSSLLVLLAGLLQYYSNWAVRALHAMARQPEAGRASHSGFGQPAHGAALADAADGGGDDVVSAVEAEARENLVVKSIRGAMARAKKLAYAQLTCGSIPGAVPVTRGSGEDAAENGAGAATAADATAESESAEEPPCETASDTGQSHRLAPVRFFTQRRGPPFRRLLQLLAPNAYTTAHPVSSHAQSGPRVAAVQGSALKLEQHLQAQHVKERLGRGSRGDSSWLGPVDLMDLSISSEPSTIGEDEVDGGHGSNRSAPSSVLSLSSPSSASFSSSTPASSPLQQSARSSQLVSVAVHRHGGSRGRRGKSKAAPPAQDSQLGNGGSDGRRHPPEAPSGEEGDETAAVVSPTAQRSPSSKRTRRGRWTQRLHRRRKKPQKSSVSIASRLGRAPVAIPETDTYRDYQRLGRLRNITRSSLARLLVLGGPAATVGPVSEDVGRGRGDGPGQADGSPSTVASTDVDEVEKQYGSHFVLQSSAMEAMGVLPHSHLLWLPMIAAEQQWAFLSFCALHESIMLWAAAAERTRIATQAAPATTLGVGVAPRAEGRSALLSPDEQEDLSTFLSLPMRRLRRLLPQGPHRPSDGLTIRSAHNNNNNNSACSSPLLHPQWRPTGTRSVGDGSHVLEGVTEPGERLDALTGRPHDGPVVPPTPYEAYLALISTMQDEFPDIRRVYYAHVSFAASLPARSSSPDIDNGSVPSLKRPPTSALANLSRGNTNAGDDREEEKVDMQALAVDSISGLFHTWSLSTDDQGTQREHLRAMQRRASEMMPTSSMVSDADMGGNSAPTVVMDASSPLNMVPISTLDRGGENRGSSALSGVGNPRRSASVRGRRKMMHLRRSLPAPMLLPSAAAVLQCDEATQRNRYVLEGLNRAIPLLSFLDVLNFLKDCGLIDRPPVGDRDADRGVHVAAAAAGGGESGRPRAPRAAGKGGVARVALDVPADGERPETDGRGGAPLEADTVAGGEEAEEEADLAMQGAAFTRQSAVAMLAEVLLGEDLHTGWRWDRAFRARVDQVADGARTNSAREPSVNRDLRASGRRTRPGDQPADGANSPRHQQVPGDIVTLIVSMNQTRRRELEYSVRHRHSGDGSFNSSGNDGGAAPGPGIFASSGSGDRAHVDSLSDVDTEELERKNEKVLADVRNKTLRYADDLENLLCRLLVSPSQFTEILLRCAAAQRRYELAKIRQQYLKPNRTFFQQELHGQLEQFAAAAAAYFRGGEDGGSSSGSGSGSIGGDGVSESLARRFSTIHRSSVVLTIGTRGQRGSVAAVAQQPRLDLPVVGRVLRSVCAFDLFRGDAGAAPVGEQLGDFGASGARVRSTASSHWSVPPTSSMSLSPAVLPRGAASGVPSPRLQPSAVMLLLHQIVFPSVLHVAHTPSLGRGSGAEGSAAGPMGLKRHGSTGALGGGAGFFGGLAPPAGAASVGGGGLIGVGGGAGGGGGGASPSLADQQRQNQAQQYHNWVRRALRHRRMRTLITEELNNLHAAFVVLSTLQHHIVAYEWVPGKGGGDEELDQPHSPLQSLQQSGVSFSSLRQSVTRADSTDGASDAAPGRRGIELSRRSSHPSLHRDHRAEPHYRACYAPRYVFTFEDLERLARKKSWKTHLAFFTMTHLAEVFLFLATGDLERQLAPPAAPGVHHGAGANVRGGSTAPRLRSVGTPSPAPESDLGGTLSPPPAPSTPGAAARAPPAGRGATRYSTQRATAGVMFTPQRESAEARRQRLQARAFLYFDEWVELLCVIAQYATPNPLVPLHDKLGAFLRAHVYPW